MHYEIFYGNILCKALRPISEGTGKFIAAAEKYLEWEEIMAQLWGGRFVGETDKTAYEFNASIRFDKRLFKEDIEGSIAHVTMLAKQGILTEEERDSILQGLAEIRDDVLTGRLVIDDVCEDIHSFRSEEHTSELQSR